MSENTVGKGRRIMIRIMDYLEETVKRYSGKIAIVDENSQITFGELRKSAMAIAEELIDRKIDKKPIVILMKKSLKCIVGFLGVAYSGNFYTPIDINMPLQRISKILDTLNPACIIADESSKELCQSDVICKYTVLLYEDILKIHTKVDQDAVNDCMRKIIDTDVLYVLFTSGSTGTPKGVIISHRSVIDYIEWVTKTFEINASDSFGNQAPFYFDNSILDIYTMLKSGATMYIIPEKLFVFPIQLLTYLKDKKISTIFWVPSAISLVANLKVLGKVELCDLKRVLFCGEPMPNKQLNMWRRAYPHALYANLYGPTEITDVCTYYIVNREFSDSEPLPIGYPCENTEIIVLNENNCLVQGDEIGELCVRGTSLSYGYYDAEEKTKEVFVQNPLNRTYREIIYRTGDLVKYNEYNELVFISRKDFQIKHMGHRIELGEIENAVNSIDGIKNCACLYNDVKHKIVLFYTADSEVNNIKVKLEGLLPEYMIPGGIKYIQDMPMNLNGKIDRNKLKDIL